MELKQVYVYHLAELLSYLHTLMLMLHIKRLLLLTSQLHFAVYAEIDDQPQN